MPLYRFSHDKEQYHRLFATNEEAFGHASSIVKKLLRYTEIVIHRQVDEDAEGLDGEFELLGGVRLEPPKADRAPKRPLPALYVPEEEEI